MNRFAKACLSAAITFAGLFLGLGIGALLHYVGVPLIVVVLMGAYAILVLGFYRD